MGVFRRWPRSVVDFGRQVKVPSSRHFVARPTGSDLRQRNGAASRPTLSTDFAGSRVRAERKPMSEMCAWPQSHNEGVHKSVSRRPGRDQAVTSRHD